MIHLISYGDKKYENAKKRLYHEANSVGWFDTVTIYGPEDLSKEFQNKFKNVLNKPRGGGFWIWKSHIIQKKLEEINDNDILIYLDAGCVLNKEGNERFNEYIEILNTSEEGIISFQLKHKEKNWTTEEIFRYFGANDQIKESGQLVGTIRIMKKNSNLMKMIALEDKALHMSPLMFTDHYNKKQNPYFKDNRHDQSIFSVIRKQHNPILIPDETYFKPFGSEVSLKYPFWAMRKK